MTLCDLPDLLYLPDLPDVPRRAEHIDVQIRPARHGDVEVGFDDVVVVVPGGSLAMIGIDHDRVAIPVHVEGDPIESIAISSANRIDNDLGTIGRRDRDA